MSTAPQVNVHSKSAIKVAVIYHTRFGSTKRLAESVLQGVRSVPNVTADLLTAEEASAKVKELPQYDAFVFGTPTFFGSMSAGLKLFLEDTTSFFVTREFQDKIAAGFTVGGSQSGDKTGALFSLFTYAAQQGMLWVPLGIAPSNNKVVQNEEVLNRHGFFSGLAAQSYIDATPGTNPSDADLRSGVYFGERFAKLALQYYH